MIDISGEWIGYYTFDKSYGDWGKDRQVPFKLVIKKGFQNFVGTLFEEVEYGGIDDKILIKGRLSDDEIEFTKYYAKEHYLDEDSEIISIASNN